LRRTPHTATHRSWLGLKLPRLALHAACAACDTIRSRRTGALLRVPAPVTVSTVRRFSRGMALVGVVLVSLKRSAR
jgi:hypothetical protein